MRHCDSLQRAMFIKVQLFHRSTSVQPLPSTPLRPHPSVHTLSCTRYQSDNECDIDWDCTTEWCRTDFSSRQPATVRTGLDDPVMPESGRVIENKTTAVMLCPSRPYRYSCRLEKQVS